MRLLLTFCFLLLTLRAAVAQSFTLDELLALRTMRPHKAASFLESHGWHRQQAERLLHSSYQMELWTAQPDSVPEQYRVTLHRFTAWWRPNVAILIKGPKAELQLPGHLALKKIGYKWRDEGSAKLRAGGCVFISSLQKGPVRIQMAGYAGNPTLDGTTELVISRRHTNTGKFWAVVQ